MRTPPSDLATAWRQGYHAAMDEFAFHTIQRNPYEDPDSTGIAVGDVMRYIGNHLALVNNNKVRVVGVGSATSPDGPIAEVRIIFDHVQKNPSRTYAVPIAQLRPFKLGDPEQAPEPIPDAGIDRFGEPEYPEQYPEPEPLQYEEISLAFPTYVCPRCGALVQSPADHDRWHAERESVLATLPRERDLDALRSRIDTMRRGTR